MIKKKRYILDSTYIKCKQIYSGENRRVAALRWGRMVDGLCESMKNLSGVLRAELCSLKLNTLKA